MEILNKIESEFDFKYPKFYKDLYQNGMLDWKLDMFPTKPRQAREILDKNPPLLWFPADSHTIDFELLDYEDIVDELRGNGFLRMFFDGYKFIPFAMTARRDYYVFCFDIADGENVPIGIAEKGVGCTILAKNFEDFIFRMLLEYGIDVDLNEVTEEEYRDGMRLMLKTHLPYIGEERHEFLLSVYQRPLTEFTDGDYDGFLSYEELDGILGRMIGFDRLDGELEQSFGKM